MDTDDFPMITSLISFSKVVLIIPLPPPQLIPSNFILSDCV